MKGSAGDQSQKKKSKWALEDMSKYEEEKHPPKANLDVFADPKSLDNRHSLKDLFDSSLKSSMHNPQS